LHDTSSRGILLTVAAAEVERCGRYGRLDVTADGGRAIPREGYFRRPGLINAGVYLMEPAVLAHIPAGGRCLSNREVFPALARGRARDGRVGAAGAFFDIGTPSSYQSFVDFCRATSHFASGEAGTSHDKH
jgi:NDP-sugar pyrophosphorylase family protein